MITFKTKNFAFSAEHLCFNIFSPPFYLFLFEGVTAPVLVICFVILGCLIIYFVRRSLW